MSFSREPVEIAGAGGWRLRGEWLLPASARAVVIAGHAMMVDRRTLDRPRGDGLVSHLANAGAAVLWPDLRGHGASGPRADAGGNWGYDDLVADVAPLLDAARARFPGLPVYTVGHSLFGHVMLAHLGRQTLTGPSAPPSFGGGPAPALDGHVMLAANVCNPGWRKRPKTYLQKGALIESMGLFCKVVGRVPVRALKQGTDDEPRGYAEDFVRIWRSKRWLSRDGFDYWAAMSRIETPCLAIVGAADQLFCPPDDAREVAERLPRCTFEVVGRASGLAVDPGHMGLVLDERCRPMWDRVAAFVTSMRAVSAATR
jgi:predicted alpha/beta hydrolase